MFKNYFELLSVSFFFLQFFFLIASVLVLSLTFYPLAATSALLFAAKSACRITCATSSPIVLALAGLSHKSPSE